MATYYRRPPGPTPDELFLRHEQRRNRAVSILLAVAFNGRRPYRAPRTTGDGRTARLHHLP